MTARVPCPIPQAGCKPDLSRRTRILGVGARAPPEARALDLGAILTEAKVRYLMTHEYASDVVWRRNKLGLRMTADEVEALQGWMRGARN